MESLINLFGRRVRVLRKSRGMTLEQLGHAAAIGYKHVAEIERGIKVPSFEAIAKLAKALKSEPYELFLSEHLPAGKSDQNLRILVRDIEKHGSPALKDFLNSVLSAARMFGTTASR
jgi:transcriptional regulator with XRE-family HTH domain